MCIAIAKKITGTITDEAMKNSFAKNPHGAGFAYVNPEGKVVVRKGWFTLDDFVAAYRKAEAEFGKDSPFLLHFRWATCGPKNAENCHPFTYEHGAMMHNGHFFTSYGEKSDSREFAEEMGFYFTKENMVQRMAAIEDAVGHNKIVTLFADKTFGIVNEKAGYWEDDVWYSNDCFRSPPAPRNWDTRSGMPIPSGLLGDDRLSRFAD